MLLFSKEFFLFVIESTFIGLIISFL